jgi:hypothetical protein
MKLENIRDNFSFSQENQKRQLFLCYLEKRKNDLITVIEVKTKQSSKSTTKKGNATLKVSQDQFEMLKLLGLV